MSFFGLMPSKFSILKLQLSKSSCPTPTENIPALIAAWMPAWESSKTIQLLGSNAKISAPLRNTSGSGFEFWTVFPATII